MTAANPSLACSEFRDLAKLTLYGSKPLRSPGLEDRMVELLSELLYAASNGKGAVPLSSLRVTDAERVEIGRLGNFFTIEHHLLRLPRYANHAEQIRLFFESRAQKNADESQTRHPNKIVREALDSILPEESIKDANGHSVIFENTQQRIAVAALCDAKIGVLTGGPGTGKTTTAAALLAVRKRIDPSLSGRDVLLTAPTGKASCRLSDSISKSARHLKNLTPTEVDFLKSIHAQTLHKALEWGPTPQERGGPFRRNAARLLEAKLILVDEASMVDLSLMHALVKATPPDATVVLMGDSDQLESVEVGGVLGELVQRGSQSDPNPSTCTQLAARVGLAPSVVAQQMTESLPLKTQGTHSALNGAVFGLKYSRRAMHAPWVLELANLLRPGTAHSFEDLKSCLAAHPGKLQWHAAQSSESRKKLLESRWVEWSNSAMQWCLDSEKDVSEALKTALDSLSHFQLLCSTNLQVDRANTEGIEILASKSEVGIAAAIPHGCPIIIQSNSHALGLSNGDIGIALGPVHGAPATLALFPSGGGEPRLIPLPQLPMHRPAFGLTIHKSQGSEWTSVAIELPAKSESAMLSKNLLYTAITRSSRMIEVLGVEEVLRSVMSAE